MCVLAAVSMNIFYPGVFFHTPDEGSKVTCGAKVTNKFLLNNCCTHSAKARPSASEVSGKSGYALEQYEQGQVDVGLGACSSSSWTRRGDGRNVVWGVRAPITSAPRV